MKKLIALIMVCGFALAFVACGGGGSTESTETAQDTTTAPADTTSTDTTATDTTAAQ